MFLDHADRVFGQDIFAAENDKLAIRRALAIYDVHIGKGFEVWRDGEIIHTHKFGRISGVSAEHREITDKPI